MPPPTSNIPPKSGVQFFSLAGGMPTPSSNMALPPPSLPPPPSLGGIPTPQAPPFGGPPPPSVSGIPPPPISGPPSGPGPAGASANFMAVPPPLTSVYAGSLGYPPGQEPSYPGQAYGAPPPNSLVGMPSEFDSNQDGSGAGSIGAQLPGIEDMDLSIQCNPCFLRSTTSKLLNSQAAANSSRVPLGIVCRPMAGDVGTENSLVDVVDFGATGIIRCKRCRTYINPFVSWVDNGRRWRLEILTTRKCTYQLFFFKFQMQYLRDA